MLTNLAISSKIGLINFQKNKISKAMMERKIHVSLTTES
jgi:hypothetical protein